MMFWGKVFRTKHDIVVAICDEELIDKNIDYKKTKIKVSKNFYGQSLIDEKTALSLMTIASIGNIIGKKIVRLAEKNGFIARKNTILIGGIPHAQFVKL